MAFKSFQLVLTGAAQRVSNVLGGAVNPTTVDAVLDIPFRTVTFQMLKANTNDAFIHDANTVSASVHGLRVDPADTAPPIILGGYDSGPIKLSDFWVLGSANDTLLVTGISY